jgi:hypothetical protein
VPRGPDDADKQPWDERREPLLESGESKSAPAQFRLPATDQEDDDHRDGVNRLGIKWFERAKPFRHHERASLSRTTPRLPVSTTRFADTEWVSVGNAVSTGVDSGYLTKLGPAVGELAPESRWAAASTGRADSTVRSPRTTFGCPDENPDELRTLGARLGR